MASTSAGQRAAIAASFAVQAAIIVAALSILTGNATSPANPPPANPPPAIALPTPSVSIPKLPAPPQQGPGIEVTVTAAGQKGLTDYPSNVETVMWVPPASEVVVTVTLTIPPGSDLGRFRLGITSGPWTGVPDDGTALVTSGKPRPGQDTYTLHLAAADLSSVNGNYLVLTGQEDGDSALTAPLAEFIVGPEP
jgi:hypothetical protein